MKKALIIIGLLISASAFAEEGMWLISQLKQLDLQSKGLQISVDDIYNPDKSSITDAIVWLGGCSSSFVSPDGLLLTNHHCGFGALQRASSQGRDYITDGFLANNQSEEIEAKGVYAYTLQETKDVTDEVLKAVKGVTDPVEKDRKITAKITQMTEKIEGDREDIRAVIASMYEGKQYILFVYKKYQDVRLVYAPPASIGNYGDDIDNWMWPRHTGDFTYLRVYQAPDGSGAKYSPNNVPLKPKNYLRISTTPLKEGDFTFIIGFPGRTNRWRTSSSVEWNLDFFYPSTIKNYQEIIDLMSDLTKDSDEGRIRVASLDAGLNNTMKNYQGNVDGMTKSNFLQKKRSFEQELMTFIGGNPQLEKEYGDVLDQIKGLYQELAKTRDKDAVLDMFSFRGLTLMSIAKQAYDTAREREKPKDKREPDFSEKKVKETVDQLYLKYYGYYEPVDKALLKRVLVKSRNLPTEQAIPVLQSLFPDDAAINRFVEEAFAKTQIADLDYAKSLYAKTSKELEKLGDPLITLAAALYPESEAQKDRKKAFNATITEYRKEYVNALLEWKGAGLYPDANSTMRFTYGRIAGYKPADAVWYAPFTTLKGVIEKNTGQPPFDAPAKLQELYRSGDLSRWIDPSLKDVPVNFLHRCDITGGNSGSAVMNAKGELIGLAFDGNYEAMTSDWQYDYDMQRTISVDIRYVLFLTEEIAGADYLLKEMGVR
jgi:hypothetical protein